MNESMQMTAPKPSNVTALAQATREMSEVQAAMMVAQARPRNQQVAIDRILTACARPKLAETALYQYARGGTNITGPSIRLAEALAQSWGNLSVGVRELEQRDGESTVEAFAHDMETNTRIVKVFQVKHERHTKRGVKDLTDPRDVYELVANQGSRRLRACILGVIPGDVVESAVEACTDTLRANIEVTPETIAKMLEAFSGYGVSKAQIEAKIQRRIDTLTPGLMIQLRNTYSSMKDGMSQAEDWFDPEPTDEGAGPANLDELAKAFEKKPAAKPAAKAAPKAAAEPANEPAPAPAEEPAPDQQPLAPDGLVQGERKDIDGILMEWNGAKWILAIGPDIYCYGLPVDDVPDNEEWIEDKVGGRSWFKDHTFKQVMDIEGDGPLFDRLTQGIEKAAHKYRAANKIDQLSCKMGLCWQEIVDRKANAKNRELFAATAGSGDPEAAS